MEELLELAELKPVSVSAVITQDNGEYMGYALRVYSKEGAVTAGIIPEDEKLTHALGIKDITKMKPGKAPAGDYDQYNYALSDFLRINTDTDPETIKGISAAGIDQFLNERGFILADILLDRPFNR